LLLAEEDPAEIVLEALDLGETREQPLLLVGAQRAVVAAGLDRLPQPDALLVVGDVLDLVRAGSGVRLLQLRQHVAERLARRVDAQDARRDAALELRRQLRRHPLRLEGRIADRLAAERVEVRSE